VSAALRPGTLVACALLALAACDRPPASPWWVDVPSSPPRRDGGGAPARDAPASPDTSPADSGAPDLTPPFSPDAQAPVVDAPRAQPDTAIVRTDTGCGLGCGRALGADCTAASECASRLCQNGVCCDAICTGACRSCSLPASRGTCSPVTGAADADSCTGTRSCDSAGTCRLMVGQTCQAAPECLSGACVDGVCCDGPCNGACQACNLAGRVGQCGPTSAQGTDPLCIATQRCDGVGACKSSNGQSCSAGGTCASGLCPAGICCADASCTPALSWARVFQASGMLGESTVKRLVAVPGGDILVVGYFNGTVDLDPTDGTDLTSASNFASFMVRLDPAGKPVWSRWLYGASMADVVATASGFFVVGSFSKTADLDPGVGSVERNALGSDGFLLKLDTGGRYEWVKTYPTTTATSRLTPYDMVLTSDGGLVVIGTVTGSADLDPGPGTELRAEADGNSLVWKLDDTGALRWSRQAKLESWPDEVSATPDGGIVYGGGFKGTVDLDPTAGVDMRTAVDQTDAFVTKLDAAGNYGWSRTVTGTGIETLTPTALSDGTVISAGFFTTPVTLAPGQAPIPVKGGDADGMLVRHAADGTFLGGSTFGGKTGAPIPRTIVSVDSDGVIVAGDFYGTIDFDPGPGEALATKGPYYVADLFVARYGADGSFRWVKPYLSGGAPGSPSLLSLPGGVVVVGGELLGSQDLDPGPGVDTRTATGGQNRNGFVTRFAP
jgi:hypothetical protein